nr:fructosamine kinase family protein [Microlunatus panaciterrae]
MRTIEAAVTKHLGSGWRCEDSVDLADRSSHPAALLHGGALSVFAKLIDGAGAIDQATAELSGLALIRNRSGAATPVPVGDGFVQLGERAVVLFEALAEHPPEQRTARDWEAIGRTLANLHQVRGDVYGLDQDGYFGPLHQDNRPVAANSWADFYADRRLLPWLATAVDAGHVPPDLAGRVEQIAGRLDELVGPDLGPRLLHGDAQHHNFISTADGAVVIDASPYYGHPELDLALVDYFTPVPGALFAAYTEISPIDAGFEDRRELWRLFAYLGVLTCDGASPFGRAFVRRLEAAVALYT